MVRARPCDCVDDASRGTAEFGGVRIGEDLELKDRLHSQKYTTHRSRCLVIYVVNVRAI
jgi:hypothetical protein